MRMQKFYVTWEPVWLTGQHCKNHKCQIAIKLKIICKFALHSYLAIYLCVLYVGRVSLWGYVFHVAGTTLFK